MRVEPVERDLLRLRVQSVNRTLRERMDSQAVGLPKFRANIGKLKVGSQEREPAFVKGFFGGEDQRRGLLGAQRRLTWQARIGEFAVDRSPFGFGSDCSADLVHDLRCQADFSVDAERADLEDARGSGPSPMAAV